jgi:hypothetical protein
MNTNSAWGGSLVFPDAACAMTLKASACWERASINNECNECGVGTNTAQDNNACSLLVVLVHVYAKG